MKKNRKRWYPEEGIPGKFLRKMKLILFLCWAGMMQVSAMSYAQTGTVSIRVKETALHEIFQLIEAQCGYTFVYLSLRCGKRKIATSPKMANAFITYKKALTHRKSKRLC